MGSNASTLTATDLHAEARRLDAEWQAHLSR